MVSVIEYKLSGLASGACNVYRDVFLDKIFYCYVLLALVSLERDYKRVQAGCKDHF